MAILFANNASTTIQGNIAFSDSTVQLAAGTASLFPQPTGSDYFVATFYDQATKSQYEIVHVTSVNVATNTATIVRGQEGTNARGWAAGDIFANLVTAGTLQQFVQAGTGPANTSFIYVGTDASTNPNHIVANTNPVPPALAVGMTFHIKVANTNTQATDVSLNGLTAYFAKRTDGSDLVGNNIVAGEEVILIWNGSHFSTPIPPIPQPPPQNVFYVSPTGNDGNSGFSWGTAFQTIQGAINSIKAKYISSNTITIRVADGSYSAGAGDSTSYIASWSIVGNTSSPGNCVINCQSTNGASYGSAPQGRCFVASGTCNMAVQGFTLESYLENIAGSGGGVMYAANNAYTTPVSGVVAPISAYTGSTVSVQGVNTYTGFGGCTALMLAAQGATMIVGYHDFFAGSQMVMNIQGTASFGGATAVATDGGVIYCYNEIGASIFSGNIPTGYQFVANNAGGLIFSTSNVNTFPGTVAGVVTAPGWLSHG